MSIENAAFTVILVNLTVSLLTYFSMRGRFELGLEDRRDLRREEERKALRMIDQAFQVWEKAQKQSVALNEEKK